MTAFDRDLPAVPLIYERPEQGVRDAARSDRYRNEVAQRHRRRSRLSAVPEDPSISSDREFDVTSALTLPTGSQLASSWIEAPTGSQALPFELDHLLALRVPGLIATRRHIHSHPELSGEEFETAALIARELSLAGLRPRLLPKGNGVICDIDGRPDGPVIALRADIDALPLTDPKDVPYRSTVDGVCHACGHDVHTTILLGVGMLLAQLADLGELPGRVRLIFQPAEEILPCGSLEVIEAGGLDDVAQIFALHCDPNLPVGKVGLRVGPITAAADNVTVRLTGPGGHTARPHLTVDLVDALGRLVTEVPALVARRVPANSGLLLVFGHASAGTRYNVIPSEACAAGTLRVMDRDTWELAPKVVGQVIAETPQSMGGEDFSWYLEYVPGALARLGVGRSGPNVDLHRASFDVDERAIPAGVRVMVQTALRALAAAS
jgi:amidohydrolase